MKAVFTGENSYGFKKDKVYDISLKVVATDGTEYIIVKDKNGYGLCPYESISAVNKN